MKILEVNKFYYPKIGGVETVAQDIAEGLNNQDEFKIDVLACVPAGKGSESLVNGVRVMFASAIATIFSMPVSFDFLKKYKKTVNGYDLIFLHYPFPLGFLAYALFSPQKKMVVWYHSDIIKQKFLGFLLKPLHSFVLSRAEKIFVASNALKKYSSPLIKYNNKCVIIPFGIDLEKLKITEEIKNEANDIRKKYGMPLVLAVGRYVYYKGFEYLIEAAKSVEARFLIIGNGPLKKKYEELIKEYNLGKKVFLLSSVKNLVPYYYACDIFVLPSVAISEAFGLVQAEAMATGKPVINTGLKSGVPEVSINNETGITVPPADSKELAEAISRLISNKELREKYGKSAKKRAEEIFSKEKFIGRLRSEIINL
jgi:rhamnosyl/mannosyltransferase